MKIQELAGNLLMAVFALLVMGCLFMAFFLAFGALFEILTNYDIIEQVVHPIFQ